MVSVGYELVHCRVGITWFVVGLLRAIIFICALMFVIPTAEFVIQPLLCSVPKPSAQFDLAATLIAQIEAKIEEATSTYNQDVCYDPVLALPYYDEFCMEQFLPNQASADQTTWGTEYKDTCCALSQTHGNSSAYRFCCGGVMQKEASTTNFALQSPAEKYPAHDSFVVYEEACNPARTCGSQQTPVVKMQVNFVHCLYTPNTTNLILPLTPGEQMTRIMDEYKCESCLTRNSANTIDIWVYPKNTSDAKLTLTSGTTPPTATCPDRFVPLDQIKAADGFFMLGLWISFCCGLLICFDALVDIRLVRNELEQADLVLPDPSLLAKLARALHTNRATLRVLLCGVLAATPRFHYHTGHLTVSGTETVLIVCSLVAWGMVYLIRPEYSGAVSGNQHPWLNKEDGAGELNRSCDTPKSMCGVFLSLCLGVLLVYIVFVGALMGIGAREFQSGNWQPAPNFTFYGIENATLTSPVADVPGGGYYHRVIVLAFAGLHLIYTFFRSMHAALVGGSTEESPALMSGHVWFCWMGFWAVYAATCMYPINGMPDYKPQTAGLDFLAYEKSRVAVATVGMGVLCGCLVLAVLAFLGIIRNGVGERKCPRCHCSPAFLKTYVLGSLAKIALFLQLVAVYGVMSAFLSGQAWFRLDFRPVPELAKLAADLDFFNVELGRVTVAIDDFIGSFPVPNLNPTDMCTLVLSVFGAATGICAASSIFPDFGACSAANIGLYLIRAASKVRKFLNSVKKYADKARGLQPALKKIGDVIRSITKSVSYGLDQANFWLVLLIGGVMIAGGLALLLGFWYRRSPTGIPEAKKKQRFAILCLAGSVLFSLVVVDVVLLFYVPVALEEIADGMLQAVPIFELDVIRERPYELILGAHIMTLVSMGLIACEALVVALSTYLKRPKLRWPDSSWLLVIIVLIASLVVAAKSTSSQFLSVETFPRAETTADLGTLDDINTLDDASQAYGDDRSNLCELLDTALKSLIDALLPALEPVLDSLTEIIAPIKELLAAITSNVFDLPFRLSFKILLNLAPLASCSMAVLSWLTSALSNQQVGMLLLQVNLYGFVAVFSLLEILRQFLGSVPLFEVNLIPGSGFMWCLAAHTLAMAAGMMLLVDVAFPQTDKPQVLAALDTAKKGGRACLARLCAADPIVISWLFIGLFRFVVFVCALMSLMPALEYMFAPLAICLRMDFLCTSAQIEQGTCSSTGFLPSTFFSSPASPLPTEMSFEAKRVYCLNKTSTVVFEDYCTGTFGEPYQNLKDVPSPYITSLENPSSPSSKDEKRVNGDKWSRETMHIPICCDNVDEGRNSTFKHDHCCGGKSGLNLLYEPHCEGRCNSGELSPVSSLNTDTILRHGVCPLYRPLPVKTGDVQAALDTAGCFLCDDQLLSGAVTVMDAPNCDPASDPHCFNNTIYVFNPNGKFFTPPVEPSSLTCQDAESYWAAVLKNFAENPSQWFFDVGVWVLIIVASMLAFDAMVSLRFIESGTPDLVFGADTSFLSRAAQGLYQNRCTLRLLFAMLLMAGPQLMTRQLYSVWSKVILLILAACSCGMTLISRFSPYIHPWLKSKDLRQVDNEKKVFHAGALRLLFILNVIFMLYLLIVAFAMTVASVSSINGWRINHNETDGLAFMGQYEAQTAFNLEQGFKSWLDFDASNASDMIQLDLSNVTYLEYAFRALLLLCVIGLTAWRMVFYRNAMATSFTWIWWLMMWSLYAASCFYPVEHVEDWKNDTGLRSMVSSELSRKAFAYLGFAVFCLGLLFLVVSALQFERADPDNKRPSCRELLLKFKNFMFMSAGKLAVLIQLTALYVLISSYNSTDWFTIQPRLGSGGQKALDTIGNSTAFIGVLVNEVEDLLAAIDIGDAEPVICNVVLPATIASLAVCTASAFVPDFGACTALNIVVSGVRALLKGFRYRTALSRVVKAVKTAVKKFKRIQNIIEAAKTPIAFGLSGTNFYLAFLGSSVLAASLGALMMAFWYRRSSIGRNLWIFMGAYGMLWMLVLVNTMIMSAVVVLTNSVLVELDNPIFVTELVLLPGFELLLAAHGLTLIALTLFLADIYLNKMCSCVLSTVHLEAAQITEEAQDKEEAEAAGETYEVDEPEPAMEVDAPIVVAPGAHVQHTRWAKFFNSSWIFSLLMTLVTLVLVTWALSDPNWFRFQKRANADLLLLAKEDNISPAPDSGEAQNLCEIAERLIKLLFDAVVGALGDITEEFGALKTALENLRNELMATLNLPTFPNVPLGGLLPFLLLGPLSVLVVPFGWGTGRITKIQAGYLIGTMNMWGVIILYMLQEMIYGFVANVPFFRLTPEPSSGLFMAYIAHIFGGLTAISLMLDSVLPSAPENYVLPDGLVRHDNDGLRRPHKASVAVEMQVRDT